MRRKRLIALVHASLERVRSRLIFFKFPHDGISVEIRINFSVIWDLSKIGPFTFDFRESFFIFNKFNYYFVSSEGKMAFAKRLN